MINKNEYKQNKKILCEIPCENILKQINKKYLFETIYKIKNIDYEEIVAKLIMRIIDSKICDKDVYISQQEIWDSEYIRVIRDEYRLHICDNLLFNRKEALEFFKNDLNNNFNLLDELWIETTEEEKEVIEIAKELNLGEIGVEIL